MDSHLEHTMDEYWTEQMTEQHLDHLKAPPKATPTVTGLEFLKDWSLGQKLGLSLAMQTVQRKERQKEPT